MTLNTALIVVDMQVGTLAGVPGERMAAASGNALEILHAFRAQQLPVVLATVNGTPAGRTAHSDGARAFPAEWSAPAPGFEPAAGDIAIQRVTWSALADAAATTGLRERGIDTVVIVGVATSFGVESTARSAYDAGFNVILPVDAIADPSVEAHDTHLRSVFPALGHVTEAAEILTMITRSV